MLIASQIRANARQSLSGKWGTAVILILAFLLVELILSLVNLIPIIGSLIMIVFSFPLSYGFLACFIKLKRGEAFGYFDFVSIAMSSIGQVWSVILHTFLKLLIPIIILIACYFITAGSIIGAFTSSSASSASSLGGFALLASLAIFVVTIYMAIKSLLYSLNFYLLYDNPNASGKDIVETSERLMNGNRCKFVWLSLTFIGWSFLCSFTFGIGYLFLIPYIQVAHVIFYEDIAQSQTSNNQYTNNNNMPPQY